MQKRSNWIIAILVIAVIALCVKVFFFTDDSDVYEELYRSQGRVEELENKLKELDSVKTNLLFERDSIQDLLAEKPKERVVIIEKYGEKIKDIDNHSAVTTLGRITDRLNGNIPAGESD